MAHVHREQWEVRLLRYVADRLMRDMPKEYGYLGEAYEWWAHKKVSPLPPPGHIRDDLDVLEEIHSWLKKTIVLVGESGAALHEDGDGYFTSRNHPPSWYPVVTRYLAHDRPKLVPLWKDPFPLAHPEVLNRLIGRTQIWRDALSLIRIAASSDITALIIGETGTGKSLVARVIHEAGQRSDKPFVRVDCKEITPDNIEEKLSPHGGGAGKNSWMHDGTLFLEDLAGLTKPAQWAMVRILEEYEEHIRENRDRSTVPRLLLSNSIALDRKVSLGEFRRDLYFRISIFQIDLPSLRQRKDDIELLTHHTIPEISARLGIKAPGITLAAIAKLKLHGWDGNVRELINVLEKAITTSPREIDESDIELDIKVVPPPTPKSAVAHAMDKLEQDGFHLQKVMMYDLVNFLHDLGQQRFRTHLIVERLGVASSTARSYTGKLVKLGYLRKIGEKRGTTYQVVPGKLFSHH